MATPKPQFQFNPTYISGVQPIFARITFGASGAPTLDTSDFDSMGVESIAQNGTGDYSLVLAPPALKFLGLSGTFEVTATGIGAAPSIGIKSYTASTRTLVIVTSDLESPAATNPASGEVLYLTLFVKGTTGA